MNSRLRLLLADDNPDEVFFITRALQGSGCVERLETASDGMQVIEKFSMGLDPMPDALVLDLNMPRKSGFDVLVWLKERNVECPVIIHTSSDDPAEAQKALTLGADAYVVKEVSYDPLIRTLSEILQKKSKRT